MIQKKPGIIAFAAHPDDAELAVSGTLLLQKSLGYSTGIVDLTAGDLGTRGTTQDRLNESKDAALLLGLDSRENLGFRDGFFKNDEEHLIKIIQVLRKLQPDIVLANAPSDRHPDHARASELVPDACFYSGLRRIVTCGDDGKEQSAWRPSRLYCYIQFHSLKPDFFVDISAFMDQKMKVILTHKSQFHDPESNEPETVISSKHFLDNIKERASDWGRLSGCRYAEGFIIKRQPLVKDLGALF